MAGVGGALNVANFAVANFSIAGSTGPGHAGLQIWAGIQHIAQRFSFGASAIFASHDFADIAALNGDPVPRLQLNANVGLSLGRFGSLGLAYAGIEHAHDFALDGFTSPPPPPSSSNSLFIQQDRQSHIVYGSYSVSIGTVCAVRERLPRLRKPGFQRRIDRRHRSARIPDHGEHELPVSIAGAVLPGGGVAIGDHGGRVGLSRFRRRGRPGSRIRRGRVTNRRVALVTAGVDQLGKQTTIQAEAQGAVSYVDGGVFLSNQIDDSFAVVDTNGVGGIAVQQENRYAGHTDSDGQLLVPDLRAFEINHLSIEPLDAPLDATVPYSSRDVRPQDRSGVVVMFPIKISNGALLRLTDEAGMPLPFGSVATLQSSGAKVPVGYDGEAYFVDLEAHNKVSVEMPDGRRCDLGFDYQHVAGKIPSIGPLACREAQP